MLHTGHQRDVLVSLDGTPDVDHGGIRNAEQVGGHIAEALLALKQVEGAAQVALSAPRGLRPHVPGFDRAVQVDLLTLHEHVQIVRGHVFKGDDAARIADLVRVQHKVAQQQRAVRAGDGDAVQAVDGIFQYVVGKGGVRPGVCGVARLDIVEFHPPLVFQRIGEVVAGAAGDVQRVVVLRGLSVQRSVQPETLGRIVCIDPGDGIGVGKIGRRRQDALEVHGRTGVVSADGRQIRRVCRIRLVIFGDFLPGSVSDRRAFAADDFDALDRQRCGGVNGDAVAAVGILDGQHRGRREGWAFIGTGILVVVPVHQREVVALGDLHLVAAVAGVQNHAASLVAHIDADHVVARAGLDDHAAGLLLFRAGLLGNLVLRLVLDPFKRVSRAVVDNGQRVDAVAGVHAQLIDVARNVDVQLVVAKACTQVRRAAVQRGVDRVHALAGINGDGFCAGPGLDGDDVVIVGGGNDGAGRGLHDHVDLIGSVLGADEFQCAALLFVRLVGGIRAIADDDALFIGYQHALENHIESLDRDFAVDEGRAGAVPAAVPGVICDELQLEVVGHGAVSGRDGDVTLVGRILVQNDCHQALQRTADSVHGVVDHGLEQGLFTAHERRKALRRESNGTLLRACGKRF